jgi:hypothetical protein
MGDTNSQPRTWRPRLSLLTALLLMTIVGMAIVLVQLWFEVDPLRAELRELRNEVGRLSIDDPTQFHAIQVRSDNEYVWKWRVWIPEGREYQINLSTESIPKTGYPQSNGMIVIDKPGESWIEYRIKHDTDTKNWSDQLTTPSGSVGSSSQPWVTWNRRTSTSEGIGNKTEARDPKKTILLCRHRVSKKATNSGRIEDPSAGFMLWLEPTK